MIEQQGRITSVDGNDAWVSIGGQSGCPACDAGEGCGAGLFGKLLNRSEAQVRVTNTLDRDPGETIMLGLEENAYLGLVMRLYGVPLLAGLLGASLAAILLGQLFLLGDGVTDILVGLAGLTAAALTLIRGRSRLPERFTDLSLHMLDTSLPLDCGSPDRNP